VDDVVDPNLVLVAGIDRDDDRRLRERDVQPLVA